MTAALVPIEIKDGLSWVEAYDQLQSELWALLPVTQLDVDLVYIAATGRSCDSARLPVVVPAPCWSSTPIPARRIVERETWIALAFVLFAALALVLVALDAHSRVAALFT